jgi:hypothetical protein
MIPTTLAFAFAVIATPPPPEVREVSPTQANLRAAVEKSLPLLWKGVEGHSAKRTCFTCHNHAVPLLAITTADRHGFPADRKKLDEQETFIRDHFDGMKDRLEKGNGPGPGPVGGGVDNTGYALFALDLLGVPPDATTTAVAHYTLGADAARDHWPARGSRPPSEASDVTTTALAVRGMRKYAPDGKRDEAAKRVTAACQWLGNVKAKDTEDRVFRLLGLHAGGATADEIAAAVKDLLGTQQADGGWAQTERRFSDAYATGSALFALHTAGGIKSDDPAYVRGLRFLLGTQLDDGSWHVRTRSRPFQTYFESGFPHEKDQFISCAATGWATAALALSCEKK